MKMTRKHELENSDGQFLLEILTKLQKVGSFQANNFVKFKVI